MALSLNDVKKKKAKIGKVHAQGKRVVRPWEETKVESASTPNGSETSQASKQPNKAELFARQMLKTAFEYKDKFVASQPVQQSWDSASRGVQMALEKNPKLGEALNTLNARLGVKEKVNQALTLAKIVEQEIREKL